MFILIKDEFYFIARNDIDSKNTRQLLEYDNSFSWVNCMSGFI